MDRRQFLTSLGVVSLAGVGFGGIGASGYHMSALTPPLYKREGAFSSDIETAMILFNGDVLCIHFVRTWTGTAATSIRVRKWSTGEILAENTWTGGMGCAIVSGGVIHIFGNTNWANNGNKIIHSTLDANFIPSAPIDALLMNAPSNPYKFYNTDITADANGFRMVVETTVGVYFAHSTNLNNWTFYGGQLGAGVYCACPTIDFINGVHYLTWLGLDTSGSYSTRTARSTDDCFTFTYGQPLLTPNPAEGTNNSDVDMVEVNGKVCGVYLDGDQSTWWELKTFYYDGTLAQMFSDYA